MTIDRRTMTGAVLAAALMAATGGIAKPVRANGDDFFQRTAKPLTDQLIFVGMVRDEDGNRLQGAMVTWTAVVGEGEDEESTFAGTLTDIIGRYRTLDVARIVAAYGYALDPTRVSLSVSKEGYTMTRSFRRSRYSQTMGLIEIDLEMARDEGSAAD